MKLSKSIDGPLRTLAIAGLAIMAAGLAWAEGSDAKAEIHQVLGSFLELNTAKKIQSDEAQALLTGEAKDWGFSKIGLAPTVIDRVVVLSDTSAAAAGPGPSGSFEKDTYFYLEHLDGAWRISAMRTMARTEAMERIAESHDEMNAEFAYLIQQTRLTLKSDRQLVDWFSDHREQLDALVESIGRTVPSDVRLILNQRERFGDASNDEFPEVMGLLHSLHVSSVALEPGTTRVTIGGFREATVGLLYSPNGKAPAIDPENHIWVQNLDGNWYLYRKT